jgi:hypothetical protein
MTENVQLKKKMLVVVSRGLLPIRNHWRQTASHKVTLKRVKLTFGRSSVWDLSSEAEE